MPKQPDPVSDRRESRTREQLVAACKRALAIGPTLAGHERAWGRLLCDELALLPKVSFAAADGRRVLSWPHWSRPPGPFDLLWSDTSGAQAAAELKLGKPGELAWDLIKLADQTTGASPTFTFAAICVQASPAVVAAPGGALLTEECSSEQRPVEWVKRWPEAWLGLMCGGHGIRPTSLPEAVQLDPPIILGDPSATHYRIVGVRALGDAGRRDALDRWGWPHRLGARPKDWAEQVAAADAPGTRAVPQRMIDCLGYKVPARFRPGQPAAWLAEHYPQMSEPQQAELQRILTERGWTQPELDLYLPPTA